MRCKTQRLVPSTLALPYIRPKDWGKGFFQFGGKWLLTSLFRRISLDVIQTVYSLELCNTTLPFLCTSDPWKFQGVNEILSQLLWVEAVQSFFCPIPSHVDEEPAEQGSASDPVPKEAGFHIPVMPSRSRLFHAASGGQLSPFPQCLIITV